MMIHPLAEIGRTANHGGSAAAMVNIVDENIMKTELNESRWE